MPSSVEYYCYRFITRPSIVCDGENGGSRKSAGGNVKAKNQEGDSVDAQPRQAYSGTPKCDGFARFGVLRVDYAKSDEHLESRPFWNNSLTVPEECKTADRRRNFRH